MSLENLLRIGQLKAHRAERTEIARLLVAAERNIVDARNPDNSTATRFDCAYKTIMQSSLAALQASGYRPDAKRPGHHMTIIQSLGLTLGVDGPRVAVLDKLREKRNLADYTGAELDLVTTEACVAQATRLLAELRAWLAKSHPQLL